jgi:hypothetical protein
LRLLTKPDEGNHLTVAQGPSKGRIKPTTKRWVLEAKSLGGTRGGTDERDKPKKLRTAI